MPYLKSSIGSRQFISLDDVCSLISVTTDKDEIGNMITKEKEYMVYCSKLDITRAEISAAGSLGLKPEMMLIIDADAYGNEKLLEYQGKKYAIYKTFQRVDGFMEVYCETRSGTNDQ